MGTKNIVPGHNFFLDFFIILYLKHQLLGLITEVSWKSVHAQDYILVCRRTVIYEPSIYFQESNLLSSDTSRNEDPWLLMTHTQSESGKGVYDAMKHYISCLGSYVAENWTEFMVQLQDD